MREAAERANVEYPVRKQIQALIDAYRERAMLDTRRVDEPMELPFPDSRLKLGICRYGGALPVAEAVALGEAAGEHEDTEDRAEGSRAFAEKRRPRYVRR